MRIGYLGAGNWGYSLAHLLASKGHEVILWSCVKEEISSLRDNKEHPRLRGFPPPKTMRFTTDISDVLESIDLLVESVTTNGVRPVFEQIRDHGAPNCPIVMTSKGIEQKSSLILPEVVLDVIGASHRPLMGELSGPGFAQEVIKQLPTSVVASAYDPAVMDQIQVAFSTSYFRVYPNNDMIGVAIGGALKNVIAIAVGISEGLGFGNSTKAALMTRGLHEIQKLAVACGAEQKTLFGLAGMGDVILTCSSTMSRNTLCGILLSQGKSIEEARKEIGMVVEGASSCYAALQLAKIHNIPMPIAETVRMLMEGKSTPQKALEALMQRTVKEEHL